MATVVYLLRHGPYEMPENAVGDWSVYTDPSYVHYAGCPHWGPDKDNIDKARTFKSAAVAKRANEYRHDSYEVVEATVTITITE